MDDGGDLRLSEILAALSYALDITDGQLFGQSARILTAADIFEAMTAERPYCAAMRSPPSRAHVRLSTLRNLSV